MLKIRRMQEDDIEFIVLQEKEMFGESLGREHFESVLNNDVYRYYVLDLSGYILGYVGTVLNGEYAQINNFYIVESHQGNGFGKKVIAYVIDKMKELGVKELSLEVRKSNVPAFKVYAHCGFRIGFVRKNYYKDHEDALVLIKKL